MKHKIRHNIMSSIITNDIDGRPYAEITIKNQPCMALFDCGANLSVLEKNSDIYRNHHNMLSILKTNSGQPQRILAYIYAKISFNGKTQNLRFSILHRVVASQYTLTQISGSCLMWFHPLLKLLIAILDCPLNNLIVTSIF